MSLPSARPLFCLVTDRRRLLPGNERRACDRLVDQVRAAADAGVHIVQVRERDLPARALAELVARCLAATAGSGTRVVVNDRLDVAIAAGASGVHLREDSIGAGRARALGPAEFLVGRSIHQPEDADETGADYLVFGTVFATVSKPQGARVAGVEGLAAAARRTALPVLAIGGVTLERVPLVSRAGAAGIAAIGLFQAPAGVGFDFAPTVLAARRAFDTSRALV